MKLAVVDDIRFERRLALVWLAAALTALTLYCASILLLLFAGVLAGVLLQAVTAGVSRKLAFSYRWSLFLVIALLALASGLMVYFAAPFLMTEFQALSAQALKALHQRSAGPPHSAVWEVFQSVQRQIAQPGTIRSLAGGVFGIASSVAGLLAGTAVIIFVGIYLAAAPDAYLRAIDNLIGKERGRPLRALLASIGQTLRHWLLGQLLDMLIIGVASGIGLFLLGIPQSAGLGLIAGLLDFVPYLGAFLGAAPAILVGFSLSAADGGYVALFFLGLQLLEGHLVTPLIQQRVIAIPPAFLVSTQLLLGYLLGIIGVALATPFTAVVGVLVQKILADRSDRAP
jgi:predicted PurR-regulated permease PerM